MSSNISGFQGVKTPLQSMTNGQYTLADYTNLNRVLSARIAALENAAAFNPNNVTIGGFLNIQSNSTNPGNLSVSNNAQVNGNLQVNKTVTVNQNLNVAGNVVVAGNINFTSTTINTLNSTSITTVTLNATTANTTNINNSGIITSNSFSGDGSLLTAIPYSALTGTVPTWNQNTTGNAATATNVAYSGLTGAVPTWNQNTTGNAATATNVAYSGLTGAVPTWNQNTTGNAATATNTTGNAATATNVAYTGLTGTVPTWNQNTTGNAATATSSTNISGGTAGAVPYQSNTNTTLFTTVGTVGQVLTSQGTATPTWTNAATSDPTKVPLSGGTMTGVLLFNNYPNAYAQNYKRDVNLNWDNPVGGTLVPVDYLYSVHDYIRISYANGNCTINLQNLTTNSSANRQDQQRKVTIVKKGMALGDYVVTLLPPTGYLFYNATSNGVSSTTIPLGRFSATYIIATNAGTNVVDLVAFS